MLSILVRKTCFPFENLLWDEYLLKWVGVFFFPIMVLGFDSSAGFQDGIVKIYPPTGMGKARALLVGMSRSSRDRELAFDAVRTSSFLFILTLRNARTSDDPVPLFKLMGAIARNERL